MKKRSWFDSLGSQMKTQATRYGGYAAVITFILIVALVVVNLIVQQLEAQVDMTESGLFTLSEQSREVIDSLEQEVVFYALFTRGQEPPTVMEGLNRYAQASPNIRVEVVDAEENPGFVEQFQEEGTAPGNGSVVVSGERFFRVIRAADLYSIDRRNPQNPQVVGLNLERRVTNALLYVGSGETPVVYEITGLRGPSIAQLRLTQNLERENFEIRQLDLVSRPAVPDDAEIVVVVNPQRDLTEVESEKLQAYLDDNGAALIAVDFTAGDIPVLNELLGLYGVQYQRGVIIEGNEDYHTGDRLALVPDFSDHPILQPLQDGRVPVAMRAAQPIVEVDFARREFDNDPLLTTSPQAFLRTNLEEGSQRRQPGDVDGPFVVARAVYDRTVLASENPTRIVVLGSGSFLNPSVFGQIPGNIDLFMNSVSWLQNQQETISVRPKSLIQFPMQLTGTLVLLYSALAVIVIPLAAFIVGGIIWLRRRHL